MAVTCKLVEIIRKTLLTDELCENCFDVGANVILLIYVEAKEIGSDDIDITNAGRLLGKKVSIEAHVDIEALLIVQLGYLAHNIFRSD